MKLENSLFVKLLGDSPYIRVLDFLLTYREFDYSKKEIAENANVSYNTLNSFWREMLNNGIIIKTRRIGKQDMFKLNQENNLVKGLIAFFDSLGAEAIDKQKQKIAEERMPA
jgi:DNA-binding transcriptional regulator YhcF (GntR family)